MKTRPDKEIAYKEYVEVNSKDDYSRAVVTFAESWASMMEGGMLALGMDPDEFINLYAKSFSHNTDTEGITGFMYGGAAWTLGEYWIHGEILRKWHNLDTQIGDEGEAANRKGTTLNPALMMIEEDG